MDGKEFRIVIADDDLDDQHLIKDALAELKIKFESFSVYTGLQLLDLLLHQEAYKNIVGLPDLIFLDINMPVLNGFDTLKEIRKHKKLSNIPIYVISTSTFEKDRQISLELGATGFYTKPDTFRKFAQIVCEIVRNEFSIRQQFNDCK